MSIPLILLALFGPDPDAVAKAVETMTVEEKAAQLQNTAPADAEAGRSEERRVGKEC